MIFEDFDWLKFSVFINFQSGKCFSQNIDSTASFSTL